MMRALQTGDNFLRVRNTPDRLEQMMHVWGCICGNANDIGLQHSRIGRQEVSSFVPVIAIQIPRFFDAPLLTT